MDAVAEAEDRVEALRSVAHLLGITEDEAAAVLDMRVARFSKGEVAQIRSEHESLLGRAR